MSFIYKMVRRSRVEITRPADTTAYTIGDLVGPTAKYAVIPFARAPLTPCIIRGVRVVADQKSIVPVLTVIFYNAAPTGLPADNAALIEKYVDVASKIGQVTLPAMTTPTDTTNSTLSQAEKFDFVLPFIAGADANLYVVLQTGTAFTPANAGKFTIDVAGEAF